VVLPVDGVVAQKLAAHAPSRVVSIGRGRRRGYDPRHWAAHHRARHIGAGAQKNPQRPVRRLRVRAFRDKGTIEVAEAAAELTTAGKLVSFAGGPDTVAA
jgi:phosphoglycerate kinase